MDIPSEKSLGIWQHSSKTVVFCCIRATWCTKRGPLNSTWKFHRSWLIGGNRPADLKYNKLVFRKPFLAVPGNHDYYNLPFPYGFLVAAAQPLRKFLNVPVTRNVSLRGSASGDTYARAFMDYLKDIPTSQLATYLKQHYTTTTDSGLSLTYQSGQFTRLPNRYYHFRHAGIDFLGLDSSTFNHLVEVNGAKVLNAATPPQALFPDLDWEQLFWLRDSLIASLNNPELPRIMATHYGICRGARLCALPKCLAVTYRVGIKPLC